MYWSVGTVGSQFRHYLIMWLIFARPMYTESKHSGRLEGSEFLEVHF